MIVVFEWELPSGCVEGSPSDCSGKYACVAKLAVSFSGDCVLLYSQFWS